MGFLIGAAIGVAIVRLFLLDFVEVIGWHMVFEHIKHGASLKSSDIEMILNSTTFMKLATGAIAGGFIGSFLEGRRNRSS